MTSPAPIARHSTVLEERKRAVLDQIRAAGHDEYGTPKAKNPDCPVCEEDEIGVHFDRVWCHLCGWTGSTRSTLRPRQP